VKPRLAATGLSRVRPPIDEARLLFARRQPAQVSAVAVDNGNAVGGARLQAEIPGRSLPTGREKVVVARSRPHSALSDYLLRLATAASAA
jgi:hypothetical protein